MLCLNNVCNTGYTLQECDYDFIDKQIDEIKKEASDAQSARHGRWTYPYKDKDINQCSECRSCVQDKISNVREMFAYCPFCGARMMTDGNAE